VAPTRPYLARAHLAGVRAKAPIVLVDATSVREHDPARWIDPNVSPLALAHPRDARALDGAALPGDIQRLVARACSEKARALGAARPLDVQLALTTISPPEDLVSQGRLDPALALRLGDALEAPIRLPRLRDRPEDLRAILTDRLAREGLRVHRPACRDRSRGLRAARGLTSSPARTPSSRPSPSASFPAARAMSSGRPTWTSWA